MPPVFRYTGGAGYTHAGFHFRPFYHLLARFTAVRIPDSGEPPVVSDSVGSRRDLGAGHSSGSGRPGCCISGHRSFGSPLPPLRPGHRLSRAAWRRGGDHLVRVTGERGDALYHLVIAVDLALTLVVNELIAFMQERTEDFNLIISSDTLVYFSDLDSLTRRHTRRLSAGLTTGVHGRAADETGLQASP